MYPKQFEYVLSKDSGVTGNLEVTIMRKGTPSGKLEVHSKRKGQGYPHAGWEAFHDRLEKGMKECN